MLKSKKTTHGMQRYYCGVCINSDGVIGGWKDFALEKTLEESDVCLFVLASGIHDDIVMDFSIFRVVIEVSALIRVSRSPSKSGRRSKYPRK